MLSFDFRIYSARYGFPPLSLPLFLMLTFWFTLWYYEVWLRRGRRPYEETLGRPASPVGFILPTTPLRWHISWPMQLVNVAVSYLLNLRDVHLYLSLLGKCVAMNQHLTRCPFGSAPVVFSSVVCCGRDFSPVSENSLRWRHSDYYSASIWSSALWETCS